MTVALKEVGLQKPVLTNRNGIRGFIGWISVHSNVTSKTGCDKAPKPQMSRKDITYKVDAAVIG